MVWFILKRRTRNLSRRRYMLFTSLFAFFINKHPAQIPWCYLKPVLPFLKTKHFSFAKVSFEKHFVISSYDLVIIMLSAQVVISFFFLQGNNRLRVCALDAKTLPRRNRSRKLRRRIPRRTKHPYSANEKYPACPGKNKKEESFLLFCSHFFIHHSLFLMHNSPFLLLVCLLINQIFNNDFYKPRVTRHGVACRIRVAIHLKSYILSSSEV